MTETAHKFPFREYLRLQGAMFGKPPQDDEYDDFILKVWEFFDLRARAEDYFQVHPYVAKSAQGALPLPWREIKSAFEKSGPPETVLTLVAKRHYGTIDAIVGNIRKVLARERSKVPIGRVQQIDSHCLRWLTRQPGYSPIEKAGARQEILGVVRHENFDTLENRVLKDFLRRCLALSSVWLRKNDKVEWEKEATVIAVRRLKALCIGALEQPVFEKVKAVSELPQPNYVLQQDRLYSRIWGEYLKILREEDVAERLWGRRDDIAKLYDKLHDGVSIHCSPCAKYDTHVWFNQLDGRNSIVEGQIWDNELLATPIEEPVVQKEDVVIIDPTFPWDNRNILICPNDHPNARPFIQNHHKPSKEPGKPLRLEEILGNRDAAHLADYFSYLHGIIGGKRWVVLVPDHWDATWLEKVICARPHALASRSDMFLLWRSVAAAIGYQTEQRQLSNGESLLVEDGYCQDKFNAISIRFMDDGNGSVIPQRASLRLHGENAENGDVRFLVECDKGDRAGLVKLGCSNSYGWRFGTLCGSDDLLRIGAEECLRRMAMGAVPYFDELDALSIVVTNRAEEVFFKPLVGHEECWPGGRRYEGKSLSPGHLAAGLCSLRLYLAEGNASKSGKLGEKVVEFNVAAEKDEDVFCQAEITPGQGLAIIHVSAKFLECPILLDLQTMRTSDMTLVGIERGLRRHFPPTMPYVEACPELWARIKEHVNSFMLYDVTPPYDLFAHAQAYWGDVDPNANPSSGVRRYGTRRNFDYATMSPIDRLKRENIFGNNPDNSLPDKGKDAMFSRLFQKLADYAQHNRRFLRLVAWTYQDNNPNYETLREQLRTKYKKGGTLDAVETSFCSNNFKDNDPRIGEMLNVALGHIADGENTSDELRLAYNLMQFHPAAIIKCESSLCERAFTSLMIEYNSSDFYSITRHLIPEWRWRGAASTQKAGYLLKCMLFLLHRRRFDEMFLKSPTDWKWGNYRKQDGREAEGWIPPGLLAEPLPVIEHESTALGGVVLQYGNAGEGSAILTHETTRLSLIEYVNGRGTLDGIPSN